MSYIEVDTNAMLGVASDIHNHKKRFVDSLQDAEKMLRCLHSAWNSDAGDAFCASYSKFTRWSEQAGGDILTGYADFLARCTTDGYQALETELNGQASKFN